MKYIKGDIWKYYKKKNTAIVIPTNGTLKNNDEAIMGRGLAKDVKDKIHGFAKLLGIQIFAWGNHVYNVKKNIYSFPTKHKWFYKSDLKLIKRSCKELVKLVDRDGYKKVILPRVGCGNGKLNWKDVKLILKKYFDDRFYIIRKV